MTRKERLNNIKEEKSVEGEARKCDREERRKEGKGVKEERDR